MALPTFYATGTASVNNGATTITFASALLGTEELPNITAGDLFLDPAQPLVPPQRLASVDYDAGEAELAVNWPGTSMTADPYEVRYVGDRVRSTAQSRHYLEMLGQLSSLGLQPNAFGDFVDRDAYDDEAEGFIFLSLDGDGVTDVWTLYIRVTATPGTWDAGQQIDDSPGPPGEGVPVGGTTGQVLTKASGTDYDTGWEDPAVTVPFTAASASGPASLDFSEDTDNGTNKVTVAAPSSIASDKTQTLLDVTGTLLAIAAASLPVIDNRVPRFDGTTGLIQPSLIEVDDTGGLAGLTTILMGHTAFESIYQELGGVGLIPTIQVHSGGTVGMGIFRWAANNVGPRSAFVKSRGSVGTHAIVQSGDMLGTFVFNGDDGTTWPPAAFFGAYVDGTPGSLDMPGRLVFGTTPDGSSTPAERLRIDSTGAISHRANATVIVDASSHLGLRSYTVATLPSAGTAARLIYVSDGTSNKRLAVSDGTNWRFPDGAIVS
jgi:hypothetical protein